MSELENTSVSPTDTQLAAAKTPQLSILHLMLWTLCSAVYLTLIRAFQAVQGDAFWGSSMFKEVSGMIGGIAMGAVISGAIVLVFTRIRSGPPLLRQPGHWLIFVPAILGLIHLPLNIWFLLVKGEIFMSSLYLLIYGVMNLFPMIAYALATLYNRGLSWKLVFIGLAVVALSQSLVFFTLYLHVNIFDAWKGLLNTIPNWGQLLLVAAVLVVSTVDLAAGQRRDWLHWTGVATHTTLFGTIVLWMIRSWIPG